MTATTRTRPVTLRTDPAALSKWSRWTIHPVVTWLARMFTMLVWRPVFAVLGPLRAHQSGALPAVPCIFVAEHTSHADTIALRLALAKIGRRKVAAAAAEDYWFTNSWRALVAVTTAGAFPFARSGEAGLQQTAALLSRGYDVILFPQGSRDLAAQRWHSGVGRLATDCGATIVAVRLKGTQELLPRGAACVRPHPISVALGVPLQARADDDATSIVEQARNNAEQIVLPDHAEGRLVTWSAALRKNAVGRGCVVLAVWAFAEATVWPLIPDLMLAGMVLAAPQLARRFLTAAVAASALGGVVAVTLSRAGWTWPMLATSDRMAADASTALMADGVRGLLHQPLSGIPYKVFSVAAAQTDISQWQWAVWTVIARGARMAVITLIVWIFARLLWSRALPQGWAGRIHTLLFAVGTIGFVAGWLAVLTQWQ